ncbi:hypothetical protein Q5H92_11380 [Hymenobacter sp. M29]|uniref:Uncharacterized protein n=1 Tax=Hymenobacter mellowenesis TaxID=3063995 RepID=A0ABT9AC27_9BACT|nr:hypothetical protein [Hymenobacter sp. M29]MDO7846962.1 hypothetical protein [Hymenobacter sp. M29]
MADAEKYRRLVKGKTLTNLFFTKQDGPYDYRPGIHPAYFFSTIMELGDKSQWAFDSDSIFEWKAAGALIELTNENWDLPAALIFKGQTIVDLTEDEERNLTFHLGNGITIAHTTDYGDQLLIRKLD